MKKWMISWIVIVVLLVGCGGQAEPKHSPEVEVSTEESTQEPVAEEEPTATTAPTSSAAERLLVDQDVPPPGLLQDRTALVAAAGNCSACHTGLQDGDGNDVSFDNMWRASMHAFAAIDPYWQASVSAEVVENPDLVGVIEDKCANCHMPLAHFDATTNGEAAPVLADGFANPDHPLHDLAMDGVSCISCHQVRADNLGSAESFSGGFMIDAENTVFGEREAYGPLPISEQAAGLMAQATGFLGVQSEHMADSEMCATCHTLYTPYLDAAGEVAGEFPEQMAYFEWQNSSYADSQSCQKCHMPEVSGDVLISTVMGEPKEYMRLHTFTGSNAFMLGMVGANGEALTARMEGRKIEDAVTSTTEMLQAETAALEILNTSIEDGQLTLDVAIASLTGHKFPTGFPSRRAWLHVTVVGSDNGVVFESGAVGMDGFIEGNDNDLDEALYEPHYNTISSPDQIQIYETILETTEGELTTTLLFGAGYAKDNRLLPIGFDLDAVIPETATHGLAAEDLDFVGGGDMVRYQVDVFEASGPFTVTVELNYQSIGYRWAENLREYDTDEAGLFMSLYDGSENLPVVVASVEVVVGE
jgi:mono/diheme cytochrome c family protein